MIDLFKSIDWENINFSLDSNFNKFTKSSFEDLLFIHNVLKKDVLLFNLTYHEMDYIFSIMIEEEDYVLEVLLDMYYYLLENSIVKEKFPTLCCKSKNLLENKIKVDEEINDKFYNSCGGLVFYFDYFMSGVKRGDKFFLEKLEHFNFIKMNKGFIYDIFESLHMFFNKIKVEEIN